MSFKHKLSKRLATIWRAAFLLPAVALLACESSNRAVAPDQSQQPVAFATAQPGTTLFQENFDDNAFASRGWYDNTSMGTTTAQQYAGTGALEAHFLKGATTPTWGGAARHLFTATPTLYVSYWVKYSDNWVGSGQTYHPHEFLVLSNLDGQWDGPSDNWLTAYIEHNYQNGGIPRLALQDNKAINTSYGSLPRNLIGITEDRSTAGCNGVVEANVVTTCFNMPPWYNDKELQASRVWFQPSPGPGYKGNWNHVEVYLQLNSIVNGMGQADGVMQYWFNGSLAIDRHDVLMRTGVRSTIAFDQFLIAPYIGDGSPVDQTMWVDNLTVATSPPASGSSDSVTTVAVSPAAASVRVGSTQQLTAATQNAAGTTLSGAAVTWATSNAAVATVDSAGLVKGLTPGSATISATSSGVTGTSAIAVTATNPGKVSNLAVSGVTDSSATLTFTEVNDGTGKPASYEMRFATGTISWGSATSVTKGSCKVPMAGKTIGAKRTCTVLGLSPATAYQFQLVAYRGTLNVNAVFGPLSNVAGKTTKAVIVTNPGTVTNLAVSGVTSSSATLTFTEVNDGTGQPASYDVRYAKGTISWGSATTVTQGTCKVPLAGTTIGAKRTCTVTGLAASTGYQFQLVAYRGTLNVNAVFGALSNVASGTTGATITTPTVAPVASVSLSPTSSSLLVGATQQFSATLKDATGNVLTGRSVTWTSSAPLIASVSSTGLAGGLLAGLSTITATSEGMSGTADLTVAATGPPPPSGSSNWPNEPAGWTTVNDYGMGALNTGAWANVYPADITDGGISVVSDASAPASPSSVWQFAYPTGFTSAGYAPATEWTTMTPTQSLYVGFWWKPSNPWQGHDSGVNKLMFMFTGDPAGLSQNMTIQMYGSGNGPFSTRMVGEGFEDVSYLENVGSTSPLALGAWHRVEILMNSPTSSLKWWVDGKLVGSYTGVPYPPYGFFQLEFSPTWGGVGGSSKTENDYFWFDHVHVSHP
jgi:uncharacterized protein YjdB